MRREKALAAFAALVFLSAPLSGFAAGERRFEPQRFDAALAAGKPVLVEIHADWCPTCRVQAPILEKLAAEPRYAKIVRLRVDSDSQQEVVKRFGVKYQSTLILFKDGAEVARSVGVTSERPIRAMLDKAF